MEKEKCWKETKKYYFYYAKDNSKNNIREILNDTNIFISNSEDPTNLGLHIYNNNIFTSNFVGVCRLKDINKNSVKLNGKEVILKVEPRFSMSVIKLLNYIKDDDEFERYLAPQTIKYNSAEKEVESLSRNEIFSFFENEMPIEVDEGVAVDSSIITVYIFLTMLRDLCKRPLMGKMIKKEENLVGKVKGKILFSKNIKNNAIRGRDDRFYCQYLKYSEDIIENQILKAALHKAKRFVAEYFGSLNKENSIFVEYISFCNKSLSNISNVKITSNQCNKLKFSGCYSHYKRVINVAKMVLDQISIESSGKIGLTNYIVPYAISMEKLFEVYVRAYLKKNGIASYKEDVNSGIQLEKFDAKKVVFNKKENSKSLANYISGSVKPDIILKNLDTKEVIIFDVKYKRYNSYYDRRSDRLQLLAYSMMYNAGNIGIIFPKDFDGQDTEFIPQEVNTLEERKVMYHQYLLDTQEDSNDLINYIKTNFGINSDVNTKLG